MLSKRKKDGELAKNDPKTSWMCFIVSVGIVGCLLLQGLATFTMNWRFYSYYYPFLYYPMYSTPHFKGERINVRRLVFAVFALASKKYYQRTLA